MVSCPLHVGRWYVNELIRHLRVHPRKDQAGAAQAILPISMKLGQFQGSTQNYFTLSLRKLNRAETGGS